MCRNCIICASLCGFLLLALCLPLAIADDDDPLRLGITTEFKLMSAVAQPFVSVYVVGDLTHVPLVIFTPELEISPCLAEDWDISQDGRSIRFYLVENATWHDGKPVTSEDVAFTLDYYAEKLTSYSGGYWLSEYLDHVEVIDDYTLEVFFTEPVALVTLNTQMLPHILPKHVWESVDDPLEYGGEDALIGCGPFIFERYDKDAGIVYFKANHDYFAGTPSVNEIEWCYFRTLDTLLLALKEGDIDAQLEYYKPVSGVYAADLIKSENVELGAIPDVGVPLYLGFGYQHYPTDVKEFRQAVSYAIDYQAIVDMIMAGYGEIAGKGYTPPTVPGHNFDLPKLEHNLTKAEEILDDAGFVDLDGDGLREAPDGSELRIPITPIPKTNLIRAAEVIDRQLEKVGLDTYVDILSMESAWNRLYGDRDYYMVVWYTVPYGMLKGGAGGATDFVDIPGFYGTCTDSKIVELCEDAMYAKNPEEASDALYEIQEYVAEEQPIIALVWGDAIYPYRTDRWEGWVPMYGYGPANYWTWFNLEPVSG